jgi:exodeoxyribonuclease-3
MKIISWNTNGLRATIKQNNFEKLFSGADIVCFQEVKATPEQIEEKYRNFKNFYSYFSHPKEKKGYSGIAIYTKEKPREVFYDEDIKELKKENLHKEGRIVGVKFKNFTLISGYYPNGGSGPDRLEYKLKFYNAFLKFILRLRKNGEKVIFCGDINTAHTEIDLARPKENIENTGFLPIERVWIDKLIKNKFIDIWRHKNPDKKEIYTYWDQKTRARDRNVGWRIDYFFVDEKLIKKIKDVGTLQKYLGSDHCPIYLELIQ